MTNEEKNLENLHIHIEGLQGTLAKRNARIAELELQVAALKANPSAAANTSKAYKSGWKDCAGHLMGTTHKLAQELALVRKDAFRLYLDGDKLNG